MSTHRTLSPRDFARTIGASESSIKRWADEGHIRCTRTKGGHRRIPLSEAFRFLRQNDHDVFDGTAFGLQQRVDAITMSEDPTERVLQHLRDGDLKNTRLLVVLLYLTGIPVSEICDGPIQEALDSLRFEWRTTESSDFRLRRAVETCRSSLESLATLFPDETGGPRALGGSIEGVPSTLIATMVNVALRAEGWDTMPLGADLAPDALLQGLEVEHPRLLWLDVSGAGLGVGKVRDQVQQVVDRSRDDLTPIALLGRRFDLISEFSRQGVFVGRSMRDLVSFSRSLVSETRFATS